MTSAVEVSRTDSGAKVFAAVGLAVAFVWPLVLAIPGVSTHQITSVHDDLVGIGVKWLVVTVLSVLAFGVQRWKVSEFGVRWLGWRDILAALGGVVAAFIVSGAASRLVMIPSSLSNLQKLAAIPLGLRIAVVLTAAICEEFTYRGFAIEELAYLTGNRWLAGLISLLLFTIGHIGLYGLTAALVIPAVVGAVLTGLYLARRNLPSCILMHTIVDGIFVILIPAAMQAR